MTNETYNGWTNYATWRVNLELFDGFEIDEEVNGDYFEELAESFIFETSTVDSRLMEDYARAFISNVNWNEIAEHLNDQLNVY